MPLYSYTCQACHKDHEAIQRFSDPLLKKCPFCGGQLRKNITSTSFQLKGGGWYKDGYASVGSENTSKKESKPAKASTAKKETKKVEKKK